MKILYTNFHHRNGGGHVSYIINLSKSLAAQHDITIATPSTSRLFQQAGEIAGVRRVDARYTMRIGASIAEIWRLRQLIKKEQFDLIHVNGSADHRHIMLARLGLRRQPTVIWTKHNTTPVNSFGHALRARLATDMSIAVSEHVARLLASSRYARRPIYTVRPGVDVHHFRPGTPQEIADARLQLFGRLPDDVVILGSTGGTDYDKGWLVLIEAISRLDPISRQRFRVVIAGDPPSQEMLLKLRSFQLEDQVVFPGLVNDVRKILAACDIGFVLSFHEAGSFATCEAMAMGLPALVSDAGGLPELVRNGRDGWVVPVGDVDTLAQRLGEILADTAVLPLIGQSARLRAEQVLAIEVFVRETEKVYAQATKFIPRSASSI